MLDLEEIGKKMGKGETIEEILGKYDWKNFERMIAAVFRENGYLIRQNFRFKIKSISEIDVIAAKDGIVFCVDCKWWSQGRYKKSGLRRAVKRQEKRLGLLKKFLKKNLIAKKLLNIDDKSRFYPLIVTLFEEELLKEGRTLVVPAWKLNGFLLEAENYLY